MEIPEGPGAGQRQEPKWAQGLEAGNRQSPEVQHSGPELKRSARAKGHRLRRPRPLQGRLIGWSHLRGMDMIQGRLEAKKLTLTVISAQGARDGPGRFI